MIDEIFCAGFLRRQNCRGCRSALSQRTLLPVAQMCDSLGTTAAGSTPLCAPPVFPYLRLPPACIPQPLCSIELLTDTQLVIDPFFNGLLIVGAHWCLYRVLDIRFVHAGPFLRRFVSKATIRIPFSQALCRGRLMMDRHCCMTCAALHHQSLELHFAAVHEPYGLVSWCSIGLHVVTKLSCIVGYHLWRATSIRK